MNRKVKIALNVTAIVLDAVGSAIREKRFKELEARVAELEGLVDELSLRSNTRDKLMAQKNREAIKEELASPLKQPPYGSGFNTYPYGKPFGN